jgi:hypothetical protein
MISFMGTAYSNARGITRGRSTEFQSRALRTSAYGMNEAAFMSPAQTEAVAKHEAPATLLASMTFGWTR